MTISVQITRGVESLFGTRDENIHLLEETLDIRTRLMNDSLEIEGEEANVVRAASILEDYAALVKEGQTFANGDLKSYLRVVAQDPEVTLRALVHSGKAAVVALTMGHLGAVLVTRERILRAHPLAIKPVSAVGAGDSFLGALIWRRASGADLEESFRQAVAAGAAALLNQGTELCLPNDVKRLAEQVILTAG